MHAQARRGMTLIELLVVMFIMGILTAFIATVLMNIGSTPRKKKAMADIAKISMALDDYKNHFGEYPPDTGYGLNMEGPRPLYDMGLVIGIPTYDPGGLWRYLCRRVTDPKTGRLVGPFLEEWPQSQLAAYDDPYDVPGQPRSRYLIDPWGNPYGFIGNKKRVLHSPGTFDIFSAGPDGVTACNNELDDDLLGEDFGDAYTDCSDNPQTEIELDNRAYNTKQIGADWREVDDDGNGLANDSEEFGPEAVRNGDIGDDINSWSTR